MISYHHKIPISSWKFRMKKRDRVYSQKGEGLFVFSKEKQTKIPMNGAHNILITFA
jgi:hypothetical protein